MLKWFTRLARPRRFSAPTFRPALEALEDRRLLAGNVLQTNLVSDLPGVAQNLDPNLVNPWGISESSASAFWISDNGTGLSTLYNGQGQPQPPGTNPPHTPLIVSIPAPGDPLGASGTPTGTVFSGGAGFTLNGVNASGAPASGGAVFLFATEDGTIVGWNPGVNPQGFDTAKAGTYGIIAVDNSASGAVYKGQAIATVKGSTLINGDPNSTALLYNANFRSGAIDVFEPTTQPPGIQPVTLSAGAFTDPKLPKGYAPFNVQTLTVGGATKIFVTYAKQDDTKHDEVDGHGLGFVDVYNPDGSGEQRLVSRGDLNAPWGLAIAPANFGALAGALLVGNFGDGHIHAYNATTGAPLGQLVDPDGEPVQIPGLWALQVGNGKLGGDSDKVYFTAGLDHENHGLFGSLTSVAPGTEGGAEAQTEAQMVQAEIDVVQLDVMAVINDITSHAPRATLRQDLQALDTAIGDLVSAEINFFIDNHMFFQGSTDGGGATLQTLDTFFDTLEQLRDHDHDHDHDHHH